MAELKPFNVLTEQEREDFIVSYVPYVQSIAWGVSKQYNCSEIDELVSCGFQGLLEAVSKFDPSKNVDFKYYAYIRVYGHMIDYMRKAYAGTNNTVFLKKKINKLKESRNANGEQLTTDEIAKELGMTLEEFQKEETKINNTTFMINFSALETAQSAADSQSPGIESAFIDGSAKLSQDDFILIDELWKIMGSRFPKREKQIMELVYLHDMSYPKIADKLGITDRRVAQIHRNVLAKLTKLVKRGIHTKPPEQRRRRTNKTHNTQEVA